MEAFIKFFSNKVAIWLFPILVFIIWLIFALARTEACGNGYFEICFAKSSIFLVANLVLTAVPWLAWFSYNLIKKFAYFNKNYYIALVLYFLLILILLFVLILA